MLYSLVRNITFDEIINTAEQIQHQSLFRELSRAIEESLESAWSKGGNVDGHYPPDIINGINSVQWNAQLVKYRENISTNDHLTTKK